MQKSEDEAGQEKLEYPRLGCDCRRTRQWLPSAVFAMTFWPVSGLTNRLWIRHQTDLPQPIQKDRTEWYTHLVWFVYSRIWYPAASANLCSITVAGAVLVFHQLPVSFLSEHPKVAGKLSS